MPKQSEENVDHCEFRTRQRREVAIVKVCVSDQIAAERAAGRNIAFDHLHAASYQWQRRRRHNKTGA
jgi:hypothetical protein